MLKYVLRTKSKKVNYKSKRKHSYILKIINLIRHSDFLDDVHDAGGFSVRKGESETKRKRYIQAVKIGRKNACKREIKCVGT